jgi:two-component system sensor kinase FixL
MTGDASPESRYPACDVGDAKFQALLEAAVDAIIMIDHQGRVVNFNAAAEQIFGYRQEQILGRNVTMLMPESHAVDHPQHLLRHLATGEERVIGVQREVQGRRRNGEVFPLELSLGRVQVSGPPQLVAIMRDVSARRRTEQEARELETRLKRVARFSTMGEMAAGLAHELNQPLAAITTYAQTACRMLADGRVHEVEDLRYICKAVGEQAQRAGEIIRRLRGFLRLQGSKRERLDCNALIREILALAELDAGDRGVPLFVELADSLPPVRGNAVEIQQVMLNLIRNAVDAMMGQEDRSRGVIIATAPREGGGLEISVTDHGSGVAPGLAKQIFHPFVTSKHNGLGVGLSISRTIVQSHGGRLTFAPNPAGGTIFSFSLPASLED